MGQAIAITGVLRNSLHFYLDYNFGILYNIIA